MKTKEIKETISIKKKITNESLMKYYKLFWQLAEVHKKLEGDTPRTSEKFSELLCAEIFDLEKSNCRECDLVTNEKNPKKIEIKGTTSGLGRTTISSKLSFDYLYWAHMTKEAITICKIPRNSFKEYEQSPAAVLAKIRPGFKKHASPILSPDKSHLHMHNVHQGQELTYWLKPYRT